MNLAFRLSAYSDLLHRYAAVFCQAWRNRAHMQTEPRLPHETQFMPAALALQERPVSPAPRVAMGLIVGFALLALSWSVFGYMDVVATARGKIVPNDGIKVIQPLETATVVAIHVRDGQNVKKGDVLIELDATSAGADANRLSGDLALAHLQIARGRAMLTAIEKRIFPHLAASVVTDDAKVAEAQEQLAGQYNEYIARRSRMQAEIAHREAELHTTQALVRKLEQTLPIASKRAADYKNLVDKKFVSEHGYLEREQIRIEQEADLAAQRSKLLETAAMLSVAKGELAELDAQARKLNLDSIADGLQKTAALQQELLKADSRKRHMQLTAPVEGTVQQLAVQTVGGVVSPAQPVMVIVPRENALEVEAFIENQDVGFVRSGQEAEVKVDTFQYTKYGTIHAKIASISHDAINDEKRGLIYAGRVKLARSHMNVDGTQVNLSPGMAVSVEIKTGKRRVIEYFLSPLMQYGNESLRER